MRTALCVVIVALMAPGSSAQTRADLAGRWVRDGDPGPGMEDTVPAWEQITLVDGGVEIVRSPRPAQVERYLTDITERNTTRIRPARACRAVWDGAAFVVTCREAADAPGGGAQPIVTREVRYLDAAGHLHLNLTWRSGEQTVTRSITFHRVEGAIAGSTR